jgi:hypothetical protein
MRRSSILLMTITIAVGGSRLAAQASLVPLPVDIGLGVDTTTAPAPELIHLWRQYLQSGPHDAHATPAWATGEQRRWPKGFDLTTPWCYGSREDFTHAHATILDIAPAAFGDTSSYAIRTLFAYRDSTMATPLPYAVCRVYAVRESGRWTLTNALGQLTRQWRRTVIGPITFVYPIAHRFDVTRAQRSATFVDSVASAFGAGRPKPIEFYVADSQEGMFRLLGLEVVPNHAPGLAYTGHRLVFSGASIYGEYYPHELVHMALDSLTKAWRTPFALDEGLAMWLGGSRGKDFPALMRDLAGALQVRPSITLETLLGSPSVSDTLAYPAAAALLQMAYERGRMSQVKAFLSARLAGEAPDTILEMAQRSFRESRRQLAALWRSRVLGYDPASGQPRKEG